MGDGEEITPVGALRCVRRGANECRENALPRQGRQLRKLAESVFICVHLWFIFRRSPDWQSLVKTILDWIAEANGAERLRRIEALNRLIAEIKVQASQLERLRSPQEQKQADEARQQIHALLKSFVDAFSVKSEVRRSD